MYKIGEAVDLINELHDELLKAKASRLDLLNSNFPKARKDELARNADEKIELLRRSQREVLEEVLRFPPHKIGYSDKLERFHAEHPFNRSVFIMTKFPAKNGNAADQQLDRVIKAVRTAVDSHPSGFKAFVAADKDWSRMLWENVEMFLMACGLGIAIVESKHSDELNPNVMMEWGWMRSTERTVLYLVEKSFDKTRADLSGLTRDEFDWDKPEPDIQGAVTKFLDNV